MTSKKERIKQKLGEAEISQRRLEGRCIYCGQSDNSHYFTCPETQARYMYGEYFVTDDSNDYYEDGKSGM